MALFDFFKFLLFNPHTQLALFVAIFGPVYSLEYMETPKDWIVISLFASMSLLSFSLMQELYFIQNRTLYAYKDLTKLLIFTKKIEHALEQMGGEGKGMYEKAESIQGYLPENMLEHILAIAEVRNGAIHGDPKINDSQTTLKKARQILQELVALQRDKDMKYLINKSTDTPNRILSLFSVISKIFISGFITYYSLLAGYKYFLIGGALLSLVSCYYLCTHFILVQNRRVSIFFFLLLTINITVYHTGDYPDIQTYLQAIKNILNYKLG